MVFSSELSANQVAVKVKTDLRMRIYKHLQIMGPIEIRSQPDFSTGELINLITEGIESLDGYYRRYLPQLALAAIVPLTYLIFIFPVDQLSGIILLVTAPLIPIFMVLIGSRVELLTKRQWQTLNRMSAYFLDVLQGIATLKLFNRSSAQLGFIALVSNRYRDTTLGILRVTFLSALVLEMVSTLSTAIVAVEIGLRLLNGYLTFEQAFFVLLLAPEFYLPLRMLGTRFHAGVAGTTTAKQIFEVLGTGIATNYEKITDQTRFVSTSPPSWSMSANIHFKDVYYSFQNRTASLNGVTFKINEGETVALVGPSGAGKSTIAHLLMRFLDPTAGQISVGSMNLLQLPSQAWRQYVTWVPQNPYLFNDTIEENVRLGRPTATQTQVIEAAMLAYAHEFIQELPAGYQTLIGDQGFLLSGGQAQRIALARAFLRDAPFLILDEATANLDPELAQKIQTAISKLMTGRTTLIIAHRLPTIYHADQIIVIDEGQVVESGPHEVLVHNQGLYRRLVTSYTGN